MTDIHGVLRERFGFDAFRDGQERVVRALLDGHSAAAVFPTGAGKSLCYQLPALLLPGVTLVVSPLIALMKDQIDALARRGIAARRLDSTLDAQEYREAMDDLRAERIKLLYVAPERFVNERFRGAMKSVRIALFAVDEAHCISEWGHNFRPDYLKLAAFARALGAERVLALTATATQPVLDEICRRFEIAPEHAVRTGFYRPNLTLLTTPVRPEERDRALARLLAERPAGPTIVYVTQQHTAEVVAERLTAAGSRARAYHAGMDDADRAGVQDWFTASEDGVVVATIAFGMGIDKADIRYVYHYNLPKSLENYAQEIGRSGRDGQPSTCEMLVCLDDLTVLENFAQGDTPEGASIESLLAHLFATDEEELSLNLAGLSTDHDIRPLVLRTLLTYLELDGWLEAGTPVFESYKFKPLRSSAEILAEFEPKQRDFLHRLFREVQAARTWFHVDVAAATAALAVPRATVVNALEHLSSHGMIELQTSQIRHRYRRLRTPADPSAVARELHDRMLEREQRDLRRLQEVVDLALTASCQVAALATHFSEPFERACAHCSSCLHGPRSAAPRAAPDPSADVIARALQVLREKDVGLATPRSVTRFLAGVSSPRLARARLGSHALAGSLAHVPFGKILAAAERLGTV